MRRQSEVIINYEIQVYEKGLKSEYKQRCSHTFKDVNVPVFDVKYGRVGEVGKEVCTLVVVDLYSRGLESR